MGPTPVVAPYPGVLSSRRWKMPFPPDAPRKIREKMEGGALPREAPSKMSAGLGKGDLCDGCETPVLTAQVEYQFEASDGRVVRLHLGCAGLWEAYRGQVESERRR